ncbi:MAG: methyltransferase protein [Nevskia sp.]|nr:methyltransferase protein [Nevskia sp.]
MPNQLAIRGGQPFSRLALSRWQRSPRGQRLLTLEQRELEGVLPDLFGRHILQIGNWGNGLDLLKAADMPHRAVLGTLAEFDAQSLARPEQLPVLNKSVDAILLPHTLEFSKQPHHVLREVNRALTDRGRLLILGFNPHSLWGLRERLGPRYSAFPPGARFVGVGRLGDWLELLDFEVEQVRRFGIGFPWGAARGVGEPFGLRSLISPFMESYLIVAKKRVLPMSLIARLPRAQVRTLVPTLGAVPSGSAVLPDASRRDE